MYIYKHLINRYFRTFNKYIIKRPLRILLAYDRFCGLHSHCLLLSDPTHSRGAMAGEGCVLCLLCRRHPVPRLFVHVPYGVLPLRTHRSFLQQV